QPGGHTVPPAVVQRGHGVIEDDGGAVRCRGQFGEESGEGDAAALTLAEDLTGPHLPRGLELNLMVTDATPAARRHQFHLQPRIKTADLAGEPLAQRLAHVLAGQLVALAADPEGLRFRKTLRVKFQLAMPPQIVLYLLLAIA